MDLPFQGECFGWFLFTIAKKQPDIWLLHFPFYEKKEQIFEIVKLN